MSVVLASRASTGTALDVWRVRLDVTDDRLAAAAALLSPAELTHADRGTPQVRRHRVVLRAGVRSALGQALGLAPADVPLCTSPAGRPSVGPPFRDWDVSCSRRAGLGLVAVAHGARIGIDVEHVVPWSDAVRREGWLTAAEAAALDSLPPDRRDDAAARRWTQKEAVLKAEGTGLAVHPSLVEVSADGGRAGRWTLVPVAVPHGFAATLACSGPLHPAGESLDPGLLSDLRTADGTPR
jgi:4'-phosphopantetheinyl transferase